MSYEILRGDCRTMLPLFVEDNSVDAIVTDPPYELGFMGKSWDASGIAYSVEMWREALRVLKPGGHLLAFSGSRTYHRMVCAIEDAGFEIRDQIMWVYGSGFPKSLDVSKAIDKAAGAEREVIGVAGRSATKTIGTVGHVGGEYMATAPATDAARQWQGWGTALKPAHEPIVVARKPLIGTVAANVLEWGTGALNVDGCRVQSSTGQLPKKESWDDEQRLCSLCAAHVVQNGKLSVPASKESTATRLAEPISNAKANTLQHDTNKPDIGCFDGTSAAVFGTSLSTEGSGENSTDLSLTNTRFTMSTVTNRTTELKTCSVCGAPTTRSSIANTATVRKNSPQGQGSSVNAASGARWPANLLHDGSDEVLAAFPETKSGSLSPANNVKATTGWSGGSKADRVKSVFTSNEGSAARFFYCAKASKSDRGEGNGHPTVKPTDLMRYLCRLVTPPGGVVLDPFTGSGSTGKAALLEGFRFIGCELSAEYADIAEQRIISALA